MEIMEITRRKHRPYEIQLVRIDQIRTAIPVMRLGPDGFNLGLIRCDEQALAFFLVAHDAFEAAIFQPPTGWNFSTRSETAAACDWRRRDLG